jgi:hypothetical protein
MARRLADACLNRSWGDQQRIGGSGFMYKASRPYLTVSITALVVAILVSLAAIFIRSVVALEMDSKNAADALLELRKSLP